MIEVILELILNRKVICNYPIQWSSSNLIQQCLLYTRFLNIFWCLSTKIIKVIHNSILYIRHWSGIFQANIKNLINEHPVVWVGFQWVYLDPRIYSGITRQYVLWILWTRTPSCWDHLAFISTTEKSQYVPEHF